MTPTDRVVSLIQVLNLLAALGLGEGRPYEAVLDAYEEAETLLSLSESKEAIEIAIATPSLIEAAQPRYPEFIS